MRVGGQAVVNKEKGRRKDFRKSQEVRGGKREIGRVRQEGITYFLYTMYGVTYSANCLVTSPNKIPIYFADISISVSVPR
jgi:hypothetical protein